MQIEGVRGAAGLEAWKPGAWKPGSLVTRYTVGSLRTKRLSDIP